MDTTEFEDHQSALPQNSLTIGWPNQERGHYIITILDSNQGFLLFGNHWLSCLSPFCSVFSGLLSFPAIPALPDLSAKAFVPRP